MFPILLVLVLSGFPAIFMYARYKQIVLGEAILVFTFTLLITMGLIFGKMAFMTKGVETFSGRVIKTVYHPEWVETYQQAHTTKVGNTTTTYYTTEYDTHPSYFEAILHWGKHTSVVEISKQKYWEISGNLISTRYTEDGDRPGFYSGDRKDYYINIRNMVPVVCTKRFVNKLKETQSLFQYSDSIPKNVKVFEYPDNGRLWESDRLLGSSKNDFNILNLDTLNSRLGYTKKVNVIVIVFEGKDPIVAKYQEANWMGGKKNDLVICYSNSPKWCYVFGWTEKEIVKRNIESIFNQSTKLNKTTLQEVEKEIVKNYVIKDWEKFNYLSIQFPLSFYVILTLITVAIQVLLYRIALNDDTNKEDN